MAAMMCSSETFKQMLNNFTSQFNYHISVCATEPTSAPQAWQWKPTGYAIARSSSGAGALIGAPASTTNGWTVATSSKNSVTCGGSSGAAGHVCILSGTSTGAQLFVTTCNSRNLTTSDTVNIPSFNIRLADPTSS